MSAEKTTVGLFGFGGFGRLIADHLAPYAELRIHDPYISVLGHASLAEAADSDIIILAVPVSEIRAICEDIAGLLRPDTIVMDVGSVKLAPIEDMKTHLPDHVQIIGTHPLFGPQSAQDGIAGRKLSLCPVRGDAWRAIRVFLKRQLKLDVITCQPEEHDREAAMVQGLTHLVAKVLADMGPLPTRMTTASFDLLRDAVDMVKDDPPSVLHAIETENPFALSVRDAFFDRAAELRGRFDAASVAQGLATGRGDDSKNLIRIEM